MAEEEVSYASVVFKNQKRSESKAGTKEETLYDEVKIRSEAMPDKIGLLSDKDTNSKCRYYQRLACCFGTLCVFLLLVAIGVCVYVVLFRWSTNELNQVKVNQTTLIEANNNLTILNNKLRADIENKNIHLNNLTERVTDLNSAVLDLTKEKQNLSSQWDQLKQLNQELQNETKNLTEQVEKMVKTQNELNVSRAQWTIDAYCLNEKQERKCNSCQKGWLYFQSSCYAYNDAQPADQKSWEEARENCRGKISDLTVNADEAEKKHVSDIVPYATGITGYWIGLRAVEGKWTWTDGTNLTNQSWMNQPANEGQCVISVKDGRWLSIKCSEKRAWICEKKALSLK